MKMYVNGCSFTYEDKIQYPEIRAWPTLVADHYGAELLNDSTMLGTNQRSVYNSILNKNNFDFFIIAWTWYSRFTEYDPVNNYETNFVPGLVITDQKYNNFGDMYYKNWYNELYQFKQLLQQIILLQSFFKTYQKKYLMLNTSNKKPRRWLQPKETFIAETKDLMPFFDHLSDDILLKEHESIQTLVKDINKENFIGWNQWAITDVCTDFPPDSRGLLSAGGHSKVAEKIINHIDSKHDSN
jgi:hypothetical protein